jgi:hypothetical protein
MRSGFYLITKYNKNLNNYGYNPDFRLQYASMCITSITLAI